MKLYFAEGNVKSGKPDYFRVMYHPIDAPCKYPCPYDIVAVDFLKDWETPQLIASQLNLKLGS